MADLTPPLSGYSIWFMAEKSQQEMLQAEIDRLAKEYGGDQFLAHGTVIGLLDKTPDQLSELKKKTQSLVKNVTPFEIELTGFGARNMYFQSLFFPVVPIAPLVEMNAQARKLFGHESDPPYMPHMSLMYRNFDWSTKQKAMRSLEFKFPMTVKIKSIALVDVYGYPNEWKIVEDYPLP